MKTIKSILIFSSLCLLFFFNSCKKEGDTIIEEYYITESGAEVFTYSQEGLEDVLLDIDDANTWTISDRLVSLDLNSIESGNVIIVETQIRLRDESGCSENIDVHYGPILTEAEDTPPGSDSVIGFADDGANRKEIWQSNETFTHFDKLNVFIAEDNYPNLKANFWANLVQSECESSNQVRAELITMIVTVYKN